MADAKKCDRCGEFYDPYDVCNDFDVFIHGRLPRNVALYDSHYNRVENWDICPACGNEFVKWINKFKEDKADEEES